MKFTRLRILGFKSFVEPADFVIEEGLTAVVGPNGCGKSNLVEAIRWVMGESSYKNMRASGMDDVIFSGNASRPARNTAEVTLYLDNGDRTAPAAFNNADELQVSRRIERASGSNYRINGREARARDVQLLFADQSTGARSPSMVGQGRVGELIQAKPQARRALLEEAAGISGLHSRRHEAELRLKAAEANLERLDDVSGELQTRIESLKRQARQAIRFRALSADLRAAEATLLHIRWTEAKIAQAAAQTALDKATLAVAERMQKQMAAVRDQGVNMHGLPDLRTAQADAAKALGRLEGERRAIDEELDRITARAREIERTLRQIEADTLREATIARDNGEVLARLDKEEAALREEADAATTMREAAALADGEARERLRASEVQALTLAGEHAEAAANRQAAERALRGAAERTARLAAERARAQAELASLEKAQAGLPDLGALRSALGQAEAHLRAAEEELALRAQALDAARQAVAATAAPLGEARAASARLDGEIRTLRKLMEGGGGKRFAPVIDAIRVGRGYEAALAAALGSDLDASLQKEAPLRWEAPGDGAGDAALPEGVESLGDHVEGPPALRRRLAQVGVTENGADLQALLQPGQRLVSRAGDLWRWDGFCARADAPSAAASMLEHRNRLVDAEREAAAAQAALDARNAERQRAETALQAAIGSEAQARQAVRGASGEVSSLGTRHNEAERVAGTAAAKLAGLVEAQKRWDAAHAEASAEEASVATALAETPDPAALQARLDAAREAFARDRAAQAETVAGLDRLKREDEARRRRLGAIGGEREAWKTRVAGAERQLATLRGRREEAEGEAARLATAPDALEARRRALRSEIAAAGAARSAASDALSAAEDRQGVLDRAASDAAQALSQAREERVRAEERLNAADARRSDTEARIRASLDVAPHEAERLGGLAAGEALPDGVDTERRIERLKSEIDRLGAVNLRAEEEARELGSRFDTILAERADVVEAVGKLRGGISALNREGRERLLQAFTAVQAHFQRLFTHLFGGGTAELVLVESDDPLEAGLDIVARPPGKKPQTMTLLSGGEQALTAMSLIFAVFLTNPAPVCVLDEVDAPLDDHNVERFCNLLDQMAAMTDTRFIVITHNPITMARMDRLFGVTMAEQGVSQLVSVDLQAAEALRETA
ncbi:MAG: chromosome segregation protein SMC [Mesorhizobium amorphae]|nr:MAG: chromosome segregation protein SMC [Mesorhizobium amorphae]